VGGGGGAAVSDQLSKTLATRSNKQGPAAFTGVNHTRSGLLRPEAGSQGSEQLLWGSAAAPTRHRHYRGHNKYGDEPGGHTAGAQGVGQAHAGGALPAMLQGGGLRAAAHRGCFTITAHFTYRTRDGLPDAKRKTASLRCVRAQQGAAAGHLLARTRVYPRLHSHR
jgi:hypothetical protein